VSPDLSEAHTIRVTQTSYRVEGNQVYNPIPNIFPLGIGSVRNCFRSVGFGLKENLRQIQSARAGEPEFKVHFGSVLFGQMTSVGLLESIGLSAGLLI